MNFKTLALVNAIIASVAGIACILGPESLLAMYGVALSPMGLVIYQFWGASLLGLGLVVFSIRSITEPSAQRAVALSLFITFGLSSAIAFRGQLAGANSVGWSTVAMFLVLAAGSGWTALRAASA